MEEKVVNELKQVAQSVERLRSIENLLEEIKHSNELITKQLERSWEAYLESTKPKQF